MRLATLRRGATTTAARIEPDHAVLLAYRDLDELLARDDWPALAAAPGTGEVGLAELDYAPVVTRPRKVVCTGLNYEPHIVESGMAVPEYPTLFAKFASSLCGAHDDIVLPTVSDQVDWEAELGVVIGRRVYQADTAQARAAIAGYTVLNDVSVRDWQNRTVQWMQGKAFESLTPIGPHLVTPDEVPAGGQMIECRVDDDVVQSANTGELVFGAVDLVRYISMFMSLDPGDVIATGTPGGVGLAMRPQRFLAADEVLVTRIEGIGECRNNIRRSGGVG